MNLMQSIDVLLKKTSPALHGLLKKYFRDFKKRTGPQLSRNEFIDILRNELKVSDGDVVFIHSSMRNLMLDFSKNEILDILREVVGESGTLLFPCWQFNIRAEDYINQNEIVFDIRNTPSAMGKIPDVLRNDPKAFRSFHPTNSIVAIGRHARELTADHDKGLYPCGEQSPLYKMMKYNARIVGIGVTVDNLTFVHTVEDTMKEQFPVKTRNEEIYDCKCIDEEGNVRIIKTLVASKAIGNRDVFGFFKKNISPAIYRSSRVKKMNFFSLDSRELYDALKSLTLSNKTIYKF